jgi:hypothetical protein
MAYTRPVTFHNDDPATPVDETNLNKIQDDGYAQVVDTASGVLRPELIPASVARAGAALSPLVTDFAVAGHSWSKNPAFGATRFDWPERLAKQAGGGTLVNAGLPGGVLLDTAANGGLGRALQTAGLLPPTNPANVTGPYVPLGGAKIPFHGFNDYQVTQYRTADGITAVEAGLVGLYSFMRAARVIGAQSADPAITYSAGWQGVGDTTISLGAGYSFTSTNNDTIDIALGAKYNGEPLTVLVPYNGSGIITGNLELSTGGNVIRTVALKPINDVTVAAGRSAVVGFRIAAGVVPVGGTLRIKATGLTGPNAVAFGGLIIEGPAPMLLPLFPPRPGYPAVTTQADWINQRVANVLAAQPWANVATVDLKPAMAPNYGTATENDDKRFWMADGDHHPNQLGLGRIAAQIRTALGTILTPDIVGQMN